MTSPQRYAQQVERKRLSAKVPCPPPTLQVVQQRGKVLGGHERPAPAGQSQQRMSQGELVRRDVAAEQDHRAKVRFGRRFEIREPGHLASIGTCGSGRRRPHDVVDWSRNSRASGMRSPPCRIQRPDVACSETAKFAACLRVWAFYSEAEEGGPS